MKSPASGSAPPQWTWKTFPRRYLMSVLAFFGFVHVYVLRVNMSVAVVAMTSNQTRVNANGTVFYEPEFAWSSKERGVVLSAYFYGYITTQIVGAYIAPLVGAGRLYGMSILFTGILALLTPMAARTGIVALVAVRASQGALQGVVFPAMHELLSFWTPPLERSVLLYVAYSGNPIGTFTAMSTCGLLAQYLSWSSIFYFYGASAMVWTTVWFYNFEAHKYHPRERIWWYRFSEKPSEDRRITEAEDRYITDSIGPIQRVKFFDAPWRSIWTSTAVWATYVAHTVNNTGLYTFLTQLPTFLNDVAGWNVGKAGFISAAPYLFLSLAIQFCGYSSDFLRSRVGVSTTLVRKILSCGAYAIQLTFLLVSAHSYHNINLAVASLAVAVAASGLSSHSVNYLDLAPQYAAILMGVGNTIGTLPGILSPIITGFLVQNKEAAEWQLVFYLVAGVFAFGILTYAIFGSGERQPWSVDVAQPTVTTTPSSDEDVDDEESDGYP